MPKSIHQSTYTELEARFPRLLRQIQWVAIMSSSEAVSTLSAYLHNRDDGNGRYLFGPEACTHFGGPKAVIEAAVEKRTLGRRYAIRPTHSS